MSLLDKTNLLITPNAVKAGKLYSVIPSSGLGDCTVIRNTTATTVNRLGLIQSVSANVPRINYLTTGGNPFILDEQQATNLILYSEDFTQSAYGKDSALIITSNNAISPSGLQNAELVENILATSTNLAIRQDVFFGDINGLSFSLSVFLKAPTVTQVGQTIRIAVQRTSGTFAASQLDYTLTNQWVRVLLPKMTGLSGSTGVSLRILNNGTSDKILIWGAQIEQANSASSYIPTAAAAVTRNADVITVAPPAGTVKITTTFSNDTTQVITSIPALFTVPAGLIKQVLMQSSL